MYTNCVGRPIIDWEVCTERVCKLASLVVAKDLVDVPDFCGSNLSDCINYDFFIRCSFVTSSVCLHLAVVVPISEVTPL